MEGMEGFGFDFEEEVVEDGDAGDSGDEETVVKMDWTRALEYLRAPEDRAQCALAAEAISSLAVARQHGDKLRKAGAIPLLTALLSFEGRALQRNDDAGPAPGPARVASPAIVCGP